SVFQTPPYNHPVSGGLHPGMAVYIEGTVPKKATRFGMNFAYGRDIILHFNPRFHYRKIVLNSCQSGKWGKEESSKLPFQKGEHFEAVFIVSETEYQVDIRDRGSFGTAGPQLIYSSVKMLFTFFDLIICLL
uniref:Galectin n=1 Tax=Laticauda laticaudata TaxID=8630 RepID=A0A8C5RP09_LATLA